MTDTPFETRTSWHAGAAVIEVVGEIDMTTAPEVAKSIDAVAAAANRVVIDLRPVDFLDSSGLSTLVRCRRDLDRAGLLFRVVAPESHGPRRVIEISRLAESLGVVSTLDDALAS